MRSFGRLLAFALLAAAPLAVRPATLAAQEGAKPAEVDIITPHITDSYELEVPWFNSHFAKEICLGRHLEGGQHKTKRGERPHRRNKRTAKRNHEISS